MARRRQPAGLRKYWASRRRRGHRGKRKGNPFLAEYVTNPKRRGKRRGRRRNAFVNRGRHRRRRNPGLALPAAFKDPMGYVQEGLVAAGAAYGAVTVGNFVVTQFMAPVPGTEMELTQRAIRYVARIGVAWGGDLLLRRQLAPDLMKAYRIGAALGVVASIAFDFLNRPFVLGPGDYAEQPGYAFAGLGLAGAGAYYPRRLGMYVPEEGLSDTGQYLTSSYGRDRLGRVLSR